jgi:4-hydroxy-4-methyl-2-oxoglutarate aldolase
MPKAHPDLDTVEAPLSSASLHEAGGRIGALPSAIRPVARGLTISGPAFPVRCPAGDNLWLHRAIYAAAAGEVIVADTGAGDEFGYWGEVMAVAAAARGIKGLVITGGVRDSERLGEIGFATFAGNVCIRGTGKDPNGDGAIGAPVTIGEVRIERGDFIFGDADGVVALPGSLAPAIAAKARQRDASEADIMRRLREGETTISIFKLPT